MSADNITYRSDSGRWEKRSMTMEEIEEMEKKCDKLETTQKKVDLFNNVVEGLGSIPVVGDSIGVFTAGITAVSTVISGSVGLSDAAKGCDSLSFDKLETIMDKHSTEINKRMDQQMSALSQVANMVQESLLTIENLRNEMHQRFEQILASGSNAKLQPIVSKLNSIIKFYNFEKDLLKTLTKENLIAKLEEPNNILLFLQKARTSACDSLHVPLMDIINQRYAIPSNDEDDMAFKALDTLVYGTQTYVSIFYFLVEQYHFLAEYYYYSKIEFEKYNDYLVKLVNTYKFFKATLIGSEFSRNSDNVIEQTIATLEKVRQLDFIRLKRIQLFGYLNDKIGEFTKMKEKLENMNHPFFEQTPKSFTGFTFPNDITTPIGKWDSKKQVQYTVQYLSTGVFSRVGPWSTPIEVQENACPILDVPVDDQKKTRLIYRKFLGAKAEYVGFLQPSQTEFRDIHRDLYNAADSIHTKKATEEAATLMNAGAELFPFENKRNAMHAAAQHGNVELATRFLNHYHADVNFADTDDYTPLHVAAEHGQDEFIKLLLQHKANVNAKTHKYELTPLHLCARQGFEKSVRAILSSSDVDVNAKDSSGYTPLHVAALGGVKTIEALLSHPNIDFKHKSKLGFTPFHLAAINNDVPMAQALVKSRRIAVNEADNKGMTALHHAALMGNTEMVKYLVSLPSIDVNAKEKIKRYTPLHFSIMMKKDEASLELLKSRKIDMETDCESSPLHVAVSFGREKVVGELLKNTSLNLEKKTREGYTALHYAAMRKDSKILSLLAKAKANLEAKTDKNGSTPLHIAVKIGSFDNILSLLQRRASIRVINNLGHSVLHECLANNDFNTIRLLINIYPPLVELRNRNEETPLIIASRKSQLAIVKHLVSKGSRINVKSKIGMTPLHYFAASGNLEMISSLLNKGADHYATDMDGKTFLHHAIENGHLSVVMHALSMSEFDLNKKDVIKTDRSMLCTAVDLAIKKNQFIIMKHFSDADAVKIEECDPLHKASYHGRLRFIKHLVETYHFKVDKVSRFEDSALSRACFAGQVDTVRYLLLKKAGTERKGFMDLPPVHTAILNNHLDILKILVEHGAHLDSMDPMKNRPLHVAVFNQNMPIVKFILAKYDNDLNAPNSFYEVPLHIASRSGNLEIVKYLVQKGAKVDAKNLDNKTPLEVAGNERVRQFLSNPRGRRHAEMYFQKSPSNDTFITPSNLDWSRSQMEIGNENAARPRDSNLKEKEGSLLLLDVLLRKLTKEKYINASDSPSRKTDAIGRALQLTEKIEDLFNAAVKVPNDEHEGFFEFFSNIYKAIRNGQENKLQEILHSLVNTVLKNKLVDKETIEQILSEF